MSRTEPRRQAPLLTLVGLVLAATLAACGGGEPAGGEETAGEGGAALEHIHGLGIDPADGRLLIATHHGLFAAGEGESTPRKVGESGQDIMGFAVAGPGHFLGSGHPGPGQDLPPNLGLIESRDGGRTWQSISLLGEADFHVLEQSGGRVYGFDGTRGRLMVSRDGGRTWSERTPPAGVFGLAVDPSDATRVVASTERGVFVSADEARTWRPLREDLGGLLAWPSADRLFLLDGSGHVLLSTDGGRRWEPQGAIGGQPAALLAHEGELYAALADGSVKRSADAGRTWTVRAAPAG